MPNVCTKCGHPIEPEKERLWFEKLAPLPFVSGMGWSRDEHGHEWQCLLAAANNGAIDLITIND